MPKESSSYNALKIVAYRVVVIRLSEEVISVYNIFLYVRFRFIKRYRYAVSVSSGRKKNYVGNTLMKLRQNQF